MVEEREEEIAAEPVEEDVEEEDVTEEETEEVEAEEEKTESTAEKTAENQEVKSAKKKRRVAEIDEGLEVEEETTVEGEKVYEEKERSWEQVAMPKKLVEEIVAIAEVYKLSKANADKLADAVKAKYDSLIVEPGEAVGIVAVQSLGEPGTQLTLRTKHFA